MTKINWTKIAGIAGVILSAGSMLVTGYANDKKMEETIKEQVSKQVAEKTH